MGYEAGMSYDVPVCIAMTHKGVMWLARARPPLTPYCAGTHHTWVAVLVQLIATETEIAK